jgi:hypothetical protein
MPERARLPVRHVPRGPILRRRLYFAALLQRGQLLQRRCQRVHSMLSRVLLQPQHAGSRRYSSVLGACPAGYSSVLGATPAYSARAAAPALPGATAFHQKSIIPALEEARIAAEAGKMLDNVQADIGLGFRVVDAGLNEALDEVLGVLAAVDVLPPQTLQLGEPLDGEERGRKK